MNTDTVTIERLGGAAPFSVARVVEYTSEASGVPVTELLGKSKSTYLIRTRGVLFYVLEKQHGMSCNDMARLFDRCHQTVKAGIDATAQEMKLNTIVRRQVDYVLNALKS